MADLRRIFIDEFCFPFTACPFCHSKQRSESRNKAAASHT
jgi:hypothetical protein